MLKYQHGGDIYTNTYRLDFSANINPLGTPESVVKAAQDAILNVANYPDPDYRKLAKLLAEKEKVSVEKLICGNGAAELIFAIVHAVNPKKALLIAPGFAEYEQALRANGCEIEFYDLKAETGFDYDDGYFSCLVEDLDMIFLCNPNNPTGLLMKREWVEKVIRICREKNIFVVLDSCFLDFLENEEEYDFGSMLDEYQNLFILKAFTKIYAMAGLRLGYGLCSDTGILDKCRLGMQPWSVSIPAQAAGEAALQLKNFVEESKELIQRERIWLIGQLKELVPELYEGKANFLFFRSIPELDIRCREKGILIRNCSNYRGLEEGYFRIAVRTHEENEELIRVFQSVLLQEDQKGD